MQKKPMGSRATGRAASSTVTTRQIRQALERETGRVPADEEKALRMIHGAALPRTTVLERVGQDHPDTRERLLGIELELLRQWRERRTAADPRSQAASPATSAATPTRPANARREKIVEALRSRKQR